MRVQPRALAVETYAHNIPDPDDLDEMQMQEALFLQLTRQGYSLDDGFVVEDPYDEEDDEDDSCYDEFADFIAQGQTIAPFSSMPTLRPWLSDNGSSSSSSTEEESAKFTSGEEEEEEGDDISSIPSARRKRKLRRMTRTTTTTTTTTRTTYRPLARSSGRSRQRPRR
jgi:hypothetical protein